LIDSESKRTEVKTRGYQDFHKFFPKTLEPEVYWLIPHHSPGTVENEVFKLISTREKKEKKKKICWA
jgi:hypothetical protein